MHYANNITLLIKINLIKKKKIQTESDYTELPKACAWLAWVTFLFTDQQNSLSTAQLFYSPSKSC